MENQNNVIFKNEDWEIKVMCTQKGNVCVCVYYRGLHMGFVNIGDFNCQRLFFATNYPELVQKASKLKEEYYANNKKA